MRIFSKRILVVGVLILLAMQAQAAIYGVDNRQDIFYVPSLKKQAQAVAVAVPNLFTEKNTDGTYRINDVQLLGSGATVNLCPSERFARQTSLGICTGFLISDRHLVTAGHCVLANGVSGEDENNPFCAAFSWYFDYNIDGSGQTTYQNIPAHHYYTCKKLIRAENLGLPGRPGQNYGNDFAIIELDRPVVGIRPLQVNSNRNEVKIKSSVYTIGHPSGLPAKFSGKSKVFDVGNQYSFKVNLDTLGGNSGSPVFNNKNEVIGILISGHNVDYYQDPKSKCQRVNICKEDASQCKQNSQHDWLEVSNSVFYIDTVMRWLPAKTL